MKKREEASLSTFRIKKTKANSFYNLIILLFTKEIIELKRIIKGF